MKEETWDEMAIEDQTSAIDEIVMDTVVMMDTAFAGAVGVYDTAARAARARVQLSLLLTADQPVPIARAMAAVAAFEEMRLWLAAFRAKS